LLYGTRYPDALERLVLVGAEVDHIEGFEEAQRAFMEQRCVRPAWTAACTAFVDGLDSDFSEVRTDADLVRWFRTVLPLYAHDPERLGRAFQGCEMPPLRMAALRATMMTNHLYPVLPDAHRVTCPTLVVTGTSEWTGVRMLADTLVEALPRGKALDIEKAGHFPWLERADVFFDAVEHFLLNAPA
jgi:pimeloyl-ACP methyl ester carboxylesterase